MFPVSLFPQAKDRLAAYASQMLQSVPSALIFGSVLICISQLSPKKTQTNSESNSPLPPAKQQSNYTLHRTTGSTKAVCCLFAEG